MKRFTFLSMAVVAIVLVVAASCTPMRDISDDYYNDGPVNRRHVYADPYYYGNAPVILQRDPYTGMYYEVSPYGYYPGTVAPPYYNNRIYNDRYYNNNNRRNNNTYRNGNNDTYQNNRNNQSNQNNSGATEQQNNDRQQQRQEARDKILGERR